jgi:hypothetical protein
MGHTRLGRLPRTKKWQEVVGLVGAGADTADIAAATLEASKLGLEDAARDPALLHSFWLLTQLPLCARKADLVAELAKIGVSTTGEATLMELVGGLSDAVDAHVYRVGGRTDLGEMAQMGAAETLTSVLGQRTTSLERHPKTFSGSWRGWGHRSIFRWSRGISFRGSRNGT